MPFYDIVCWKLHTTTSALFYLLEASHYTQFVLKRRGNLALHFEGYAEELWVCFKPAKEGIKRRQGEHSNKDTGLMSIEVEREGRIGK